MAGHLEQDGAVHDNNIYEVRPPPGRLGPTQGNQAGMGVVKRTAHYSKAKVDEGGKTRDRLSSEPDSFQSEESGGDSDKQLQKKPTRPGIRPTAGL